MYISEMSHDVLIRGDNRSQKVLNAIGEEVGLVKTGSKAIGSCSIVGKFRTTSCTRENGTPLGRKFSVSFSLRLNKLLPRGCKDRGPAADIWNVAVTSGRQPDGRKGFVTYLLDGFEFPGCEPRGPITNRLEDGMPALGADDE